MAKPDQLIQTVATRRFCSKGKYWKIISRQISGKYSQSPIYLYFVFSLRNFLSLRSSQRRFFRTRFVSLGLALMISSAFFSQSLFVGAGAKLRVFFGAEEKFRLETGVALSSFLVSSIFASYGKIVKTTCEIISHVNI